MTWDIVIHRGLLIDGSGSAPERCDEPSFAFRDMQSLQGKHRSTAEGGNEGELMGQIPMALQGAPTAGSTEELCQLLKNRGQLLGHVLLPRLEPSKQWGSAWMPATLRERGPSRCYLGHKGTKILPSARQNRPKSSWLPNPCCSRSCRGGPAVTGGPR